MFETFVHQFLRHMRASPDALALVCIEEDGSERKVKRADFLAAVQRRARSLQSQGVSGGDVFLIVLPHGMELFASFWAALLLGAVPVIYAYPGMLETRQGFIEQLGDFTREVQCDWMLVPAELYGDMTEQLEDSAPRILQAGDSDAVAGGAEIDPPRVASLEHTAILQFSSGTTGAKKGVIISHRAMANYLEACQVTMRLTPDDVMVSWLPLNHDMGLIACFVLPLSSGFPTVIMSPRHWISSPAALFHTVNQYRGSITFMPNFAFGYCAKSVGDEQLAGHDLSCWRLLVSGAEPVQLKVLEAFSRRFTPFGLPPRALSVGYGMAECVLGVSRTPLGDAPQVDWIDQKRLLKDGTAVPCTADAPGAKAVTSCGRPHPMVQAEVVGDDGLPLPDRAVGEVRVKSTALFSGYYSAAGLDQPVTPDEWFHTGDLGYLHDGELYVCGRKKDLIILFGSNIYPGDIEAIAESFPPVRKGRTVAFGVDDERRGTEKVILLCELQDGISTQERTQLVTEIRERVWQKLDVLLSAVDFVERGWVVKTTSGKLARSANREKYLGNTPGTTR